MNLSKAKHGAMEIMNSNIDKATQKTDFVWVPYVKMGLFGKSTLASLILNISLPNLQSFILNR